MPDPVRCRSPWIEQLAAAREPQPLVADASTDVAVIGAGIAGVATAFFLTRETDFHVLLIERGRAAHGATGHNAGQLTTYFERPLYELVDEYGFEMAISAQRSIDEAWDLLDIMVEDCGATVPIDRFVGHMGMFTLDHLSVHLRNAALRRAGGLAVGSIMVASTAPFLDQIDPTFADLYTVAPIDHIRDLLGTEDPRYCAVMSDVKGCTNGALLVEQILEYLQSTCADRFRFVDHTAVDRITLEHDTATIRAGEHRVSASRVVMCTNGFVDHVVENLAGEAIRPGTHHRVVGDVGYMVGFVEPGIPEPGALSFIRNEVIGGDTPYVYSTSRAYDGAFGMGSLTCVGGPEQELDEVSVYDPEWEFPSDVLEEFDRDVLPIVAPRRPRGSTNDYVWHGLMGYTESRVRLIGAEPRNPILLYNLGCNGVGFLPSIVGGHRSALLIRGDDLASSIFDPT